MKRSNVLLITNLFPNPEEPNRGVFVFNMAAEVGKMVDLTIISPLPWFPKWQMLKSFKNWYKFSLIPQTYTIKKQNVICPKYLAIPKAGWLHSFSLFAALLPVVWRLNKNRRFDLINAHWLFPDGVASYWISKILKVPLVSSARGCDINHYLTYKLRRPQILSSLRYANRITVVSEAQKENIIRAGISGSKINTIKNGIDIEKFRLRDKKQCREELNVDKNITSILFIGQLVPVKGFDYLIEAAQKLVKAGTKNFIVTVIGEGPLRPQFERKIKEMGLEGDFAFLGEQPHDKLSLWYGASDLLCLPSIREGCPNVVMEALASGRPVVASRIGGIPELINEKNGILFTTGMVSELTKALKVAVEKKWDESEIRNSVIDCTWNKVAGKFFDVFESVVFEKEKANT